MLYRLLPRSSKSNSLLSCFPSTYEPYGGTPGGLHGLCLKTLLIICFARVLMLQLADCGVCGCACGCWIEVVTDCTCYIAYYQEASNLTPYCRVFLPHMNLMAGPCGSHRLRLKMSLIIYFVGVLMLQLAYYSVCGCACGCWLQVITACTC
jgi:hypothetical protein